MVFMIYVASEMLSKTNTLQSKFGTVANAQSSGNGSIIGAMAFFMIPIVILWVGIGFAQSMSIAGAQIARKAGFGAMKWASTAPAKAGWWGI